jgi:hypothetical protein
MSETTYVYRCGEAVAHIKMHPADMARVDEVTKEDMLDTIARRIGSVDHKHNFELTEEFENISVVIHDCWPTKEESL